MASVCRIIDSVENFADRMELDDGESIRLSEPSLELATTETADLSQGYTFQLDPNSTSEHLTILFLSISSIRLIAANLILLKLGH